MTFYPIALGIARPEPKRPSGGAKKSKGGTGKPGSASSALRKITPDMRQKIFERDSYTCRCCGFQSKKYQEVLFLDHDRSNFDPENLATACAFCHQCFNLEDVAEMKSGFLVWLPEISQADLHHIVRAIYVARISQGPIADCARKTLDILTGRREEAVRRIGTDNPYILSMVMRDYLTAGHYAQRTKKLNGIRLFPQDRRIIKEADLEFNQFPQILAYWRSKDGPFGSVPPTGWVSLYKDIMKAA